MAMQVRGIANPIMAAYSGMFLTKQALNVSHIGKNFLHSLLIDLCDNLSTSENTRMELAEPAL